MKKYISIIAIMCVLSFTILGMEQEMASSKRKSDEHEYKIPSKKKQ